MVDSRERNEQQREKLAVLTDLEKAAANLRQETEAIAAQKTQEQERLGEARPFEGLSSEELRLEGLEGPAPGEVPETDEPLAEEEDDTAEGEAEEAEAEDEETEDDEDTNEDQDTDEDQEQDVPELSPEGNLEEGLSCFSHCQYEEALPYFEQAAEAGLSPAMYFLTELYWNLLPKDRQDYEAGKVWARRGAALGDVLCRLNAAFLQEGEAITEAVQKVLPELKAAAEQGNSYAACELARLYQNGKRVPQDPDKALYWMKRAGQKGDAGILTAVGVLLQLQKKYEQALYYFREAADKGSQEAWLRWGDAYQEGLGFPEDLDLAKAFYQRAYNLPGKYKGSAANKVGELLYNLEEYPEAVEWFQKAAKLGDTLGMFNLGQCCLVGLGTPKDLPNAQKYLRKAYERGGATAGEAANGVGRAYFAQGCPVEANAWFQKAAEKDYDWGWYNLARNLLLGRGIPEDQELARKYFQKAYAQGGEAAGDAAYELAQLYCEAGKYVEGNAWCEKCGEAGNPWGWYHLADNVKKGLGTAVDLPKAVELYIKASNIGDGTKGAAANQVGLYYAQEESAYVEAAAWYKKAGDEGFGGGYFNLAGCYEAGDGVPQDGEKARDLYVKAYEMVGEPAGDAAFNVGQWYLHQEQFAEALSWFQKSAELDFECGYYALAACYAAGKGVPANLEKTLEFLRKTYACGEELAGLAAQELGNLYLSQDQYEEANAWNKIAGDLGQAQGYYLLAQSYWNGSGVEADPEKAVELLKKTYSLGGTCAAKAAQRLSTIYSDWEEPEEAQLWQEMAEAMDEDDD